MHRLSEIPITNAWLRSAIDRLADAYAAFSASNGDSAAEAAVAAAGQQVSRALSAERRPVAAIRAWSDRQARPSHQGLA